VGKKEESKTGISSTKHLKNNPVNNYKENLAHSHNNFELNFVFSYI